MTKEYTRQLRTESVTTIFPLTAVVAVLFSLLAYVQFTPSTQWITIFSIITSIIGYRLANYWVQKERPTLGVSIFLAFYLVLLTLNWMVLWQIHGAISYLYIIFIIIAGLMVSPLWSFYVWFISLLLMMAGLLVGDQMNSTHFFTVIGISSVHLLIAGVTYLAIIDWEVALESTSELHLKAQQRRDELFGIHQELEQTNARLQFLNKQLETNVALGQRITSILELDTLLQAIADLIGEQLRYGYVAIFLLDEQGEQVEIRAESGLTGIKNQRPALVRIGNKTPVGVAAQKLQFRRVDDVSIEKDLSLEDMLPGMRSAVAVPLVMGDVLLGILEIQTRRAGVFNDLHILVLQALADQVTTAVQNAILYHREANRRKLAETLYQIGRDLSGTLNLSEVLDLILERLSAVIPYERASIMFRRGSMLETVAARGYPEDTNLLEIRVPLEGRGDDDIFFTIYRTQRPLLIADAAKHPTWQQQDNLPQARAWLGIPLIRDNEVTGMLSLVREVPEAYHDDDVTLAIAFAGQAALALANARLYDKITRFNQQLEYEVQKRTEAIRDAFDRLEKLDKAKTDFIGVASHELRTPLTIVQGYSSMLLDDKGIQQNPYYMQIIKGINTGSIRLHEIVNDMLDMVKIDNRTLEFMPEPVYLYDLIEGVVINFEEACRERKLNLTMSGIENLPSMVGDSKNLRKLFYHLVINAIKYTPDGGSITITGRPLAAREGILPEDGVLICVQDTGIGIDPKFHEPIFTKFYQTGKVALHSSGKTKFKGGGPGLGLAIASGIVEVHRGKIWVESEGYDETTLPGSQFYVALPLAQGNAANMPKPVPNA